MVFVWESGLTPRAETVVRPAILDLVLPDRRAQQCEETDELLVLAGHAVELC